MNQLPPAAAGFAHTDVVVRTSHGTLDAFAAAFTPFLSRSGIFLSCREPHPPGSRIRFMVALQDGRAALRGSGTVEWSRRPSGPFERPRTPGMAVRVTQWHGDSLGLVERMRAGPFGSNEPLPDLDPPPVAPDYLVQLLKQASNPRPGDAAARSSPHVPRQFNPPKVTPVAVVPASPTGQRRKNPTECELDVEAAAIVPDPHPSTPVGERKDRLRELERSEAELLSALGKDPGNGRLRLELGLVYFGWSGQGTNHDAAAEACFTRALELDPGSDVLMVHLGNVQRRRGLLRQSRRSYRSALERNPHSREAREGLELQAVLRVRAALPLLAAAALALLLAGGALGLLWPAATPSSPPVGSAPPVSAPGTPPTVQGPPVAVAMAVAAPSPVPMPPPAEVQVAAPVPAVAPPAQQVRPADPAPSSPPAVGRAPDRGEAEPGRQGRAVTKVARVSSPRPADIRQQLERWVKQGDAALRSGKVEEALTAYNSALRLDANHGPAHRGLGSVFVMQGRDSEAAAAYRRYLALAPGASDSGRIRGILEGLN